MQSDLPAAAVLDEGLSALGAPGREREAAPEDRAAALACAAKVGDGRVAKGLLSSDRVVVWSSPWHRYWWESRSATMIRWQAVRRKGGDPHLWASLRGGV